MPKQSTWDLDFWINGEPASLKNQRRIVRRGKKLLSIKSAKAMKYWDSFVHQIPPGIEMLEGDLYIHVDVYYASRRPDLSCLDIIKDILQGHAYENDRQIKAESAVWNLDRSTPRTRIRIRRMPSSGCTERYSEMLSGTLELKSST